MKAILNQGILNRSVSAGGTLLLACMLLTRTLPAAQADQVANAEKQKTAKKDEGSDLATLLGVKKQDQAAVERGKKIFVPNCGFCHGNDAHGKSGPDLVRSTLVLHDTKGDAIGPVIRSGRTDRGMPAFSTLSGEQIADISEFLHSRATDVSNRFGYKIGDIVTGNAEQGRAFFTGAGGCAGCHSPTGDLAHVAGKYEAVELQRRMLYPAPNFIEVFLGKVKNPPAPMKVTVRLTSGEEVTGTLDHLDEFTVAMHDASGWYRSFDREKVKVDVQNPRAAHDALLPKYTDNDMHNVLAYLETLK
jgi:cytochrome c oxidase cbb3-type subunit 3